MYRKIDERDTILARIHYKKGTVMYDDYYKEHPEQLNTDEKLRSLGEVFDPGSKQYNPVDTKIAAANFDYLEEMQKYCDGPIAPQKITIDPKLAAKKVKALAKHYGANLVGITDLEDSHFYSKRGRREDSYNDEVNTDYKYGIVIAVKMDQKLMQAAPQISEAVETSNIYVKVGTIGMQLSYFIRNLGYEARNNMDGNYIINTPVVAVDAGLGELGRMGLLVTKEYGPRVRLAVVTTNLPLVVDSKETFGLKEFCILCRQCAKACPAAAIPLKKPQSIKGIIGWQINQEKCFEQWLIQGTDCGVCLNACPFFHNDCYKMIDVLDQPLKKQVEFVASHENKMKKGSFRKAMPSWFSK
jgi:reductive dehalogenase